MGKLLIIKGADFSINAVDHTTGTPGVVTYAYDIPDSQFNSATGTSTPVAQGFGLQDQSAIRGHYIHGIRLNVSTAGSMTILKYNGLISVGTAVQASGFTELETLTTTSTGLQELEFSNAAGYYLDTNETLVFGRKNETLCFKFVDGTTPSVQQLFLGQCSGGENAVSAGNSKHLTIDVLIS